MSSITEWLPIDDICPARISERPEVGEESIPIPVQPVMSMTINTAVIFFIFTLQVKKVRTEAYKEKPRHLWPVKP